MLAVAVELIGRRGARRRREAAEDEARFSFVHGVYLISRLGAGRAHREAAAAGDRALPEEQARRLVLGRLPPRTRQRRL